MRSKIPLMPGSRFGQWTAVRLDRRRSTPEQVFWVTRCDCGAKGSVNAADLRRGKSKRCLACAWLARKRHGMSQTPEYFAWVQLRRRCEDPNNASFARYGGRGIRVCERWRRSFEFFYADMGPRPSPRHSVDRINNDGNYCRSNCRWATQVQQKNNCRNNRWIEWNGRVLTLSQWSRRLGAPKSTLFNRLRRSGTIAPPRRSAA